MIRRPPRSTQSRSSAASDVYKRRVVVSVCVLYLCPFVSLCLCLSVALSLYLSICLHLDHYQCQCRCVCVCVCVIFVCLSLPFLGALRFSPRTERAEPSRNQVIQSVWVLWHINTNTDTQTHRHRHRDPGIKRAGAPFWYVNFTLNKKSWMPEWRVSVFTFATSSIHQNRKHKHQTYTHSHTDT